MAEFRLDEAQEVLRRTPVVLQTLLGSLPDSWLTHDEGPDTWSPRDVVGHLIHGELDDWIPRTKIILNHGESRPFEPFDRFAFRERIKGKSCAELLDEFAALRKANLETLAGLDLSAGQLAQRGTHPAFGSVTLAQLIATWAVHDLSHIYQIARVMASRYETDVGPWKEYLGVLKK